MEKFKDNIKAYLKATDKIGVAVSGGSDSMCLLHCLLSMNYLDKKNITVIHLNHKLRGENAERDYNFVRDFCAQNNLVFKGLERDINKERLASRRSFESEARKARHDIFLDFIKSSPAECVITAHNAEDNVESILMHMLRGSGLNGIKGMEIMSSERLFRPLISTSKESINEYLRINNVPHIFDETNTDSAYSRNYLRNEILPLIKKRWNGAEKAILNLSKEANDALAVLEKMHQTQQISYTKETAEIPVSLLCDPYISSKHILTALKQLGVNSDIERKHIDKIIALQNIDGSNKKIELPLGITVEKEYEIIRIRKKNISETETIGAKTLSDYNKPLSYDPKKLPLDVVVRYRKDGDLFTPYNGRQKKLKDYFIDKKIPVRLRDLIPLICKDNIVYMVIGVEISDLIKVDDFSKAANSAVRTDYDNK